MSTRMEYPDIRVVRTKTSLRNALIDLLQTSPYNSINVTNITKKAGINRVTFYNHYSSKEDLMSEVLELLLSEYESLNDKFNTQKLKKGLTSEIEYIIKVYYYHFEQYSKVYKILLSDEFPEYKEQFIEVLQSSIHFILSIINRDEHADKGDYDFIINWSVGGTIQTIQNYINKEEKVSADIIAKRMIKMAMFMLSE